MNVCKNYLDDNNTDDFRIPLNTILIISIFRKFTYRLFKRHDDFTSVVHPPQLPMSV